MPVWENSNTIKWKSLDDLKAAEIYVSDETVNRNG
jgi:hypothetical protein